MKELIVICTSWEAALTGLLTAYCASKLGYKIIISEKNNNIRINKGTHY